MKERETETERETDRQTDRDREEIIHREEIKGDIDENIWLYYK